ncbi:MAG: nuclear transport factor 2 family protein [Phenylobacterium sp.]
MSDQNVLAFAERFVGAIERGDTDAVRACYAPDAKLWHNTDGIEQTVDENMKVLDWFVRKLPDRHYRIVRREALPDGFLQQHVLEATLPDGRPFRMNACCVIRMKDGVIARLDEYLDSAEAKVLREFGR